MNKQPIKPKIAGGNQLFTLISVDIVDIYGDKVLPIMPKTLVHP